MCDSKGCLIWLQHGMIDQWLPRVRYEGRELTSKRHERTFGGDGNVFYHNCGDDYMTEYVCQNLLYCVRMGWGKIGIVIKRQLEGSSW